MLLLSLLNDALCPFPCAVKAWVRYAKFEMQSGGDVGAARACYERAIEELGEDANNVSTVCAFCRASVWRWRRCQAVQPACGTQPMLLPYSCVLVCPQHLWCALQQKLFLRSVPRLCSLSPRQPTLPACCYTHVIFRRTWLCRRSCSCGLPSLKRR